MTVEENLKDRHFDSTLHKVWVDEAEGVATVPLWNLSGQLVGYQQYRPSAEKNAKNDPRDSRYFTYVSKTGNTKKEKTQVALWGLESWYTSNTLFVTEGVFDACKLTYFGVSAVAVLSYTVSDSTKAWFHVMRQLRPLVAVCDSDSSGRKLAKLTHTAHFMENGDMGDASVEYVKDFLKQYK